MNHHNHFLTSFLVLALLFRETGNALELALFAFAFGVLIDENQNFGKSRPAKHRRTWVEEPFGLLLIGVPIGLLFSLVKSDYFFMVTIPYATHIIQDYLTIHEVSPLAPFSNLNLKVGIFKAFPHEVWYSGEEKGVSENYFTFVIAALLLLLVLPI